MRAFTKHDGYIVLQHPGYEMFFRSHRGVEKPVALHYLRNKRPESPYAVMMTPRSNSGEKPKLSLNAVYRQRSK